MSESQATYCSLCPKSAACDECIAFFEHFPQHPTKHAYMFQLFQAFSLQEAMTHHYAEQVGSRLI